MAAFHWIKDYVLAHEILAQLTLFAVVLLTLWAVELVFLKDSASQKLRIAGTNFFVALWSLPVQGLLSLTLIATLSLCGFYQFGLIYHLSFGDSFWVKYVMMFVLLDLADYFYHRLMHRVPFLWRFHKVHHTAKNLDVTTTFCEHPGETFVRNIVTIVVGGLLGANLAVLMIRQAIQTISNILSHFAVNLPRGWDKIGMVLVTPNFHHVHHHYKLPYTDRNFGDTFSFWDRLFGTYAALPREKLVFGLNSHFRKPLSGWDLVKLPFRPVKKLQEHSAAASSPSIYSVPPVNLANSLAAGKLSGDAR